MNCPAISAKEDIALIADAIRVERFCRLNFHRLACGENGEDLDMDGQAADIEKEVRTVINDNINNGGGLDLRGSNLDCVLTTIERVLSHHKHGYLDDLRKRDCEMERLCYGVRANLNRLREIHKHLTVRRAVMDTAAGRTESRATPTSTIARDDVPIMMSCLRIEGYDRALRETHEVGVIAAASNIENELHELVNNNLDDKGNLQLVTNADIMLLVDAALVVEDVLDSGRTSLLRNDPKTNRQLEILLAERQAIIRITDQLLRDIGAYD